MTLAMSSKVVSRAPSHGQLLQPIKDLSASWLLVAGMTLVAKVHVHVGCGVRQRQPDQRPTRSQMLRCPRTDQDVHFTTTSRQNGTDYGV
jgi:hypothetical protein